ncbi:MAG: HD domain-containing protein, partial [Gammaproteobacteria bacterium]|nr:HD domain-containing protein [Gammaproteobacteria bacterium]
LGSSVWCTSFGRHLGLEKPAIETLSLGGLLLDIGKSKLPGEFLTLIRELTPAELRVMQKHVQFGEKIISEANKDSIDQQKYNDVKQMITEHHERSDGSGYPKAIENKDISFFGRMAGIVDSFDAMTSERPYMSSEPLSPNNAVNELYSLRGSKFQTELIEQFIQTVGIYPTGSLVELNTGAVGVVVSINNLRRLRPTIMLILDENKESLPVLKELNLDKVSNDTAIAHGLASGVYNIDIAELFL